MAGETGLDSSPIEDSPIDVPDDHGQSGGVDGTRSESNPLVGPRTKEFAPNPSTAAALAETEREIDDSDEALETGPADESASGQNATQTAAEEPASPENTTAVVPARSPARRRAVLATAIVLGLLTISLAALGLRTRDGTRRDSESVAAAETTTSIEATSTSSSLAVPVETAPPPTEPPTTAPPTTAQRRPVATTPDLVGMTVGAAMTSITPLFTEFGITSGANGVCPPETPYPIVCNQTPSPGTPLYPGDNIRIGFGRNLGMPG